MNPYDSREDPIVCGALVGANLLISLDDVLDAERNFWEVTKDGTCSRREIRRHNSYDDHARFHGKIEKSCQVLAGLHEAAMRHERGATSRSKPRLYLKVWRRLSRSGATVSEGAPHPNR